MHDLPGGIKVFAGQRADGFYVDLGAIFDLGDLRPFENLHAQYGLGAFTKAAAGVNATAQLNVHSIAIQVPISQLLWGSPHGAESDQGSVIGVWTTASRQAAQVWDDQSGANVSSGPFRQVSRLGNPLVNEVLIPLGRKDFWNTEAPGDDKQFASYVAHPELAGLLPALYPGVFPNLAKLVTAGTARADLEAILLTGIPSGIVPGLPELHRPGAGGHAPAEHRDQADRRSRASSASSAATWPASPTAAGSSTTWSRSSCARSPGRPSRWWTRRYKPDAAAALVTDGLTDSSVPSGYLDAFPYLGVPYSGFNVS